ncbi:LysR family transcriptional regulator [Pseudooceanicola sediminis]|uniref:LysR family transcriptional regulator n=1 Tax=Pseudooceanicola sediminis TaxID=2211117 RepID=A0A399J2T8_9RHOB|nr:LysR family transcriptional regulator [Pseudooceanicola sediminis]RII39665.1 LysR family transcriptional regulator [Pseudooceanicola sediminis]|tara:strand:+ start:48667 stop:49578 length:912 start_codon:yes stop_codon:yes gene_type:complete
MSKPVSWEDQRIFLAVLEDGSLSAAARRLGVSHPTVRSRIDALERALDTVLFTRSVNGLVPTETALALREPARAMAMASDLFVRQGSSVGTDVSGTVRISVPDVMGVEVIPRMLRTLRNDHPDLQIELSLSNLPADLLAQEVDIAVRTVTPTQKALIARKVASIPLGLFAAPDYLGQRGTPMTLSDLARHDFIGPDRNHRDLALAERLILAGRLGADLLRDRMVVRIDSHPAQVAAARAGLGIAIMQVPLGAGDDRLVHLLPDFEVALLQTWIVMHENLSKVPRVRAAFDSLAASFTRFGDAR